MKLTRDSVIWTFVILAASATYLATMPPPTVWTWAQWCQTVAVLAGIVAGKLSTSPLRGENDPPQGRIGAGALDRIGKSVQ